MPATPTDGSLPDGVRASPVARRMAEQDDGGLGAAHVEALLEVGAAHRVEYQVCAGATGEPLHRRDRILLPVDHHVGVSGPLRDLRLLVRAHQPDGARADSEPRSRSRGVTFEVSAAQAARSRRGVLNRRACASDYAQPLWVRAVTALDDPWYGEVWQ